MGHHVLFFDHKLICLKQAFGVFFSSSYTFHTGSTGYPWCSAPWFLTICRKPVASEVCSRADDSPAWSGFCPSLISNKLLKTWSYKSQLTLLKSGDTEMLLVGSSAMCLRSIFFFFTDISVAGKVPSEWSNMSKCLGMR